MGTPSSILQKIQVEVVSNFHCSRIIEESIGPGMICAAPPALQGTCFVSIFIKYSCNQKILLLSAITV